MTTFVQDLYDYEKNLSDDKRKNLGIVYTPQKVVDHINDYVLSQWHEDTPPRVCDFSCGTGVFLVDIANKISKRYDISLDVVYQKYIFANDVDGDATKVFKSFTGCPNVTNIDGLDYDLDFCDIIVSNPPYIKIQNLDENTRDKVKNFSWCQKGNTDIYIAMCQKIFGSNKIYGIICPNSWIRSETGVAMKSELFDKRLISEFIDFRNKKIFKAGAYTCIMMGNGKRQKYLNLSTDIDSEKESTDYQQLEKDNFHLTISERDFILENSKKDTLLLDEVDLKVGLATLADKVYFLPECREDSEWVYSGDIKIEKAVCKPCFKASVLKRYNKDIKDYIIYPYDSAGNILSEIDFKSLYPKAYEYLTTHKEKLLSRDKGKFKNKCENGTAVWFEYGRKQGVSLKDEKILVSPILTKKTFMKVDDGLFISGYCFQTKDNAKSTIDDILKVVGTKDFETWVSIFGDPKQGNYYSIKTKTLIGFRYNK